MTLDSILDMSFDQIELAARCVQKHKIDMINMVLEPVASAFGAKKSKKQPRKSITSNKKKEPIESKERVEAKEQHKLHQLNLLGIGVRDI